MWIIYINEEDPVTAQGLLDEFNRHQTPSVKYTVNFSLWGRKSYQRTDLEDICYIFDQVRPVVSHLEFRLQKKHATPKNIDEYLKVPWRKLRKEALVVNYDKNKNVSLLSDPITIIYLPEGTKVLRSLIAPSIKKGYCSDAWKFVVHNFANGCYQIKGIYFYQSYIPMAHADSFRINIAIVDRHRLTASILDVSNAFQN